MVVLMELLCPDLLKDMCSIGYDAIAVGLGRRCGDDAEAMASAVFVFVEERGALEIITIDTHAW